jgi:hypothetical protein
MNLICFHNFNQKFQQNISLVLWLTTMTLVLLYVATFFDMSDTMVQSYAAFKPTSPVSNVSDGKDNNEDGVITPHLSGVETSDSNSQNAVTPSFSESQIDNSSAQENLFLTYKNSEYDFSMTYPYKWKIIEGDRIPGAHIPGVETIVAFVPPGELATSNGYTAFVEVLVDHNAENIDLEVYLSENVQDILKDRSLTNLTLERANTDALLSGRPAYVMSYSVDRPIASGNPEVIVKEIGTKVGEDIYFIVYVAHKDRVDKYFNDAQKMVNSFNLPAVTATDDDDDE